MIQNTATIILAAGRGSRMKAKNKNKVAFKLGGQPMIAHTVNHLLAAGIKDIITVIGFQGDSVKKALGTKVSYVTQTQQLGTGDAIKTAIPLITPGVITVLAISGDDSAFYPPGLFTKMITKKQNLGCDILFLTIHKDDPTGLGRIIRDHRGKVASIVEEKVSTDDQKKIQEINTGFYCFDRDFLFEYIDKIKKNPVSGEYYLTDLVEIAIEHGKKVETFFVKDDSIWQGVNNRSDFAKAQAKIKT
ncbi:hypothetical protein COT87_03025 [Candidatus Collierbacteria bacterium CG10_big_fil_rev_8_21_14_0_10_44_9]|uniref:Nucleotidyl transferase domain-containing protein n=1 Tax=Candidatus Collierbacteria bacterium CG10_big_fil_rev_8_21_14_0_10_44_9 TaxID=1974535 RepID=A0A2H0VKD9_9BACT|nr:MAG: hypothetical protein COT87_03025 [Candidatus Collierbacteria bacterium CG10_big_fil_rev_8_21_14_0_10_44_9]